MARKLKDVDGARNLNIDATSRPGSVFVWGKGFFYEIDRGLWDNAMLKEGAVPAPVQICCEVAGHTHEMELAATT